MKQPPFPSCWMKRKTPETSTSSGFDLIMNSKKAKASSTNASRDWESLGDGGLLALRHHKWSAPLPKIAAFDMDGTLVTPKSGRPFPKDRFDWQWLFPKVPTMLRDLSAKGYEIVIFTNQKGLKDKVVSDITGKIDDLISELGVPVSAYIATEGDMFRKPCRGMWDAMLDTYYDLAVANQESEGKKDEKSTCYSRCD